MNLDVAKAVRVDSFVMETNIDYPTQISLIWDGLRKIIELSALVAVDLDLSGLFIYARISRGCMVRFHVSHATKSSI